MFKTYVYLVSNGYLCVEHLCSSCFLPVDVCGDGGITGVNWPARHIEEQSSHSQLSWTLPGLRHWPFSTTECYITAIVGIVVILAPLFFG